MGRDGRITQRNFTVVGGRARMSATDLPSPDTKRWVARRKAAVVDAVRYGVLTLDDACARYALTVEEFLSWQSAVDQYGLAGLRITHAQEHRLHHHAH